MKKSFLFSLLVLLLSTLFSFSATAAENAAGFAGGDGTEEAPYLIETAIQLDNVRNYPSAHFQLKKDIRFVEEDYADTGFFYNSGQGWTPIGDEATPFAGSFDGNGYTVDGLYQNTATSTNAYAGLFGYINGATVKNINLTNVDLTVSSTAGSTYAGSIAGYAKNSSITGCSGSGRISSVKKSISGYGMVGGIVAFASNTNVTSCYNAAALSSTAPSDPFVGGIEAAAAGSMISNCYNTGSITANATYFGAAFVEMAPIVAGQFAGTGGVSDGYTIKTSYNIGKMFGAETAAEYLDYCVYYDDEAKLVQLSASKMALQDTYDGFDFADTWQMGNGGTYLLPTLRGLYQPSNSQNTTSFAGGSGMVFDPYLISTKTHLDNVRNYPDAYFELAADIIFTDDDFAESGAFYNAGQGWLSIGSNNTPFNGTFDGNGHTVTGLYQNLSSGSEFYCGLFGNTTGAEVRDLNITGASFSVSIKTANTVYAGFVAGRTTNGTFINCHTAGSITASSSSSNGGDFFFGGIVGIASCGVDITSCSYAGSITGTTHFNAYAGGILGKGGDSKASAAITDCRNTGNISIAASGGSGVGGIMGSTSNDRYNPLTITNCLNTGNVTSNGYAAEGNGSAGGILGSATVCNIFRCCNTGNVTNSKYEYGVRAGGIAGYTGSSSAITDCYNTGAVSASMSNPTDHVYSGGIVGQSDGSITNCYNIAAVAATPKKGAIHSGSIVSDGGKVSNCYYLLNTCATGDSEAAAVCYTEAQMKVQRMFIGFDFTDVWQMGDGLTYEYPTLQSLTTFHVTHTYDQKKVDDQFLAAAATCQHGTLYFKSCICGAAGTETFAQGASLDHSFTVYIPNNDATCLADGTEHAECDYENCTATHTRTIEDSRIEHRYGDWFAVIDATYTEQGEEMRVCLQVGCEEFETRPVPATGPALLQDVSIIYASDSRTLLLLNTPHDLTVVLAFYDGDQFVDCILRYNTGSTTSFLIPEGYDLLTGKVFFLTENWVPIGVCANDLFFDRF